MCLHSSRGGSPGGCQGMGWGLSAILFQGATDSHSPPCSSWHQGKAPKANLCLDGEVGNGFSVSVFGTHMERCDPATPPPSHGRRDKATTRKTGANPNRAPWKGEQRAPHWKLQSSGNWGSQEGRKMFIPCTLSHACLQLHVTAEFYEHTERIHIPILREQVSTNQPSSPGKSNVCECVLERQFHYYSSLHLYFKFMFLFPFDITILYRPLTSYTNNE